MATLNPLQPMTSAIGTQPGIDWSQPYSYGGTNWTIGMPSQAQAAWQQASQTGVDPQATDTLNYINSAFGNWAQANQPWLAEQGYTGGTSGLESWLQNRGYQFGYGQQGGTIAGNVFDQAGNPVGGGATPGAGTGYDWGWTVPVGMFLGAGALAGGFGGGAAAGGGGGLSGVDAAMADYAAAGGGAGITGGATPAAAYAGTGGMPGAGYGTAAGPAITSGPGGGINLADALSGIGKALGTPGSGGWQGIANLIAGLYGANKTSQLAKLPSMQDYLSSPMFGAGQQAVERAMAAQGFQGSGNMMQALASNAQQGYANYVKLLTGRQQQAGDLPASMLSNFGLATSGMPAIWNLLSGVGGTAGGSANLLAPGAMNIGGSNVNFGDVSSIWGGS